MASVVRASLGQEERLVGLPRMVLASMVPHFVLMIHQ